MKAIAMFVCVACAALSGTAVAQAPASAPPAPSPVLNVAIFDVHVQPPVDPRVGVMARAQLERSSQAMGFASVPEQTTKAVAARALAQGALDANRATDLTRQAGASRGVFASIRSANGRYLASVQVVGDGEPRSSQAEAGPNELDGTLDRLLRSLLPSPVVAPPPPAPTPVPATPEPEWPPRFRLALKTESAFGLSGAGFYNHLLGARIDRRFTPNWALGVSVAYANLKGREGRAHNVLPMAELEYRAILSDEWAIPIRFGSGYLPKNGPVIRASAGISYAVAEDIDLGLDVIAPMAWVTNERSVVSLNAAAEVGITF
jgi:hypothetical protein